MVSISKLYKLSENEWLSYFKLLKACDEEIIHKSIIKNSWSIEKILRHLLDSLIQINNNALDTEEISSDITIKYNEDPKDKIPLEVIEEEYHRINYIIKQGMEKITEKLENEPIFLGEREIPRGRYLIHLLAHEHNHFGQVIWIFRRLTKWSMEKVIEVANQ